MIIHVIFMSYCELAHTIYFILYEYVSCLFVAFRCTFISLFRIVYPNNDGCPDSNDGIVFRSCVKGIIKIY